MGSEVDLDFAEKCCIYVVQGENHVGFPLFLV